MALNRCEECARSLSSKGQAPDYGRYPWPRHGDRCDHCRKIYDRDMDPQFRVAGTPAGRKNGAWRPLTGIELMEESIREMLEMQKA